MSETSTPQRKRNLPPNRVYCCVFGCLKNTNTNPDISFFSVPKDPQKRIQWLQIICREDLIERNKSSRVCEVHFQQDDIMKSRRKVLKKCALPRLHLPCQNIDHKETQTDVKVYHISTQTDEIASDMIKMENVTMNNISYETKQIDSVEIKNEENNFLCQTEDIESVKIKYEMNNISCQTDQPMSLTLDNTIQSASLSTETQVSTQKRKLKYNCLGCQKRFKHLQTVNTLKSQKDLRQFHSLCDRFLPNKLAKIVKARTHSKSNRRKRVLT